MASLLQPIGGRGAPSTLAMVKVRLQEAIRTGELAPGDRLIQEELCQQLDVSRQPVREALRSLQSEGLVAERERGGGYVVRVFTEEEIRENYELRKLLEGRATAQAADDADEAFLRNLEATNAQFRESGSSGDPGGVLEANRRFHSLIWQQAHWPLQASIIGQLWCSVTTFTPLLLPDRARLSFDEHLRIIEALRARDPVQARKAMTEHISRASADFELLRSEDAEGPFGSDRGRP